MKDDRFPFLKPHLIDITPIIEIAPEYVDIVAGIEESGLYVVIVTWQDDDIKPPLYMMTRHEEAEIAVQMMMDCLLTNNTEPT